MIFKKFFGKNEEGSKAQLKKTLSKYHNNQTKSGKPIIDNFSLKMLLGVLSISEKKVKDIMLPISQSEVLAESDGIDFMRQKVLTSEHSRYPLIPKDSDQIEHIIFAKEFLGLLIKTPDPNVKDLAQLYKKPLFVSESMRLDYLLKEFQNKHYHLAIVSDEYDNISGIVTLEDVVEEIVGDIEEDSDIKSNINIQNHGIFYSAPGVLSLEDFNAYFKTNLSDEKVETLGGFIADDLGRIPKRGDTLEIDKFELKVVKADRRKVNLIQIKNL